MEKRNHEDSFICRAPCGFDAWNSFRSSGYRTEDRIRENKIMKIEDEKVAVRNL